MDGKVWLQDAGTYTVLRLDIASGKFEVFEPYKIPRPNVYDVIPDAQNNGYFLVVRPRGRRPDRREDRRDRRSSRRRRTRSAPRRGMMDAQDRLWFGENSGRSDRDVRHADRDASRNGRRRRPESWPYDVTADKNGEVWAGGEYNDRILRLDPKTRRQFTEYLLPRFDERPAGVRRQLDDAGHVLGGQQPRRVDREARAAGLSSAGLKACTTPG